MDRVAAKSATATILQEERDDKKNLLDREEVQEDGTTQRELLLVTNSYEVTAGGR
jgi:hypothetical protein